MNLCVVNEFSWKNGGDEDECCDDDECTVVVVEVSVDKIVGGVAVDDDDVCGDVGGFGVGDSGAR